MNFTLFIDSKLDYTSSLGKWWSSNLVQAISLNPYKSIFAVMWITISVFISAFFIYILNYKISFYKLDIEDTFKKKLAFSLAIFTAPYLFYLPTAWFY